MVAMILVMVLGGGAEDSDLFLLPPALFGCTLALACPWFASAPKTPMMLCFPP